MEDASSPPVALDEACGLVEFVPAAAASVTAQGAEPLALRNRQVPSLENDDGVVESRWAAAPIEASTVVPTHRSAKSLWLEYDDPNMEERYVNEWLYRSRRMNVSVCCALGSLFVATFVATAFTPFPANTPPVGLVTFATAFILAPLAVFNVFYGGCYAAEPLSTSFVDSLHHSICRRRISSKYSLVAHEATLILAGLLSIPYVSAFYEIAVFCLERTGEPGSHYDLCVGRIPSAAFVACLVFSFALPMRCRIGLPFIALVFPAASLATKSASKSLPRDSSLDAIRATVTGFLCLTFAVMFVVKDRLERRSFEAWLLAEVRTKRAIELRQTIDETLKGSLPLSVAQRVTSGKAVCDVAIMATVGVCELFDFAVFSSQQLLPSTALSLINELFLAFDMSTSVLQCDRLKAVGDMYVISAGINSPREAREGCEAVCRACLAQLGKIRQLFADFPVSVRIAAHTAPAVGVLVGVRSLSYEVFGPVVDATVRVAKLAKPNTFVVTDVSRSLYQATFADREEVVPGGIDINGVSKIFCVVDAASDFPMGSVEVSLEESSQSLASHTAVYAEDSSFGEMRYRALRAAAAAAAGSRPTTFLEDAHVNSELVVLALSNETNQVDRESTGGFAGIHVTGRDISHSIVRSVASSRVNLMQSRSSDRGSVMTSAPNVASTFDEMMRNVSQLFISARSTSFPRIGYGIEQVESAYAKFEASFSRHACLIQSSIHCFFMISLIAAYCAQQAGKHSGYEAKREALGLALLAASTMLAGGWLIALNKCSADPSSNVWLSLVFSSIVVVILPYVALIALPLSIVNTNYWYVFVVICGLILSGSNGRWGTCVVLMLENSVGFLLGAMALADFTPFTAGVALVLGFFVIVYSSFQAEKALRGHFETMCLSNAQRRACEDELAMQRKMYEMLLPPFLAKTMIHRKLTGSTGYRSLTRHFNQLAVIAVRIDGLSLLMSQLLDDPQTALRVAETIFFRIEEVLRRAIVECCPAEYAPVSDELLCKISVLGDEITFAGPFVRERVPDKLLATTLTACVCFLRRISREQLLDAVDAPMPVDKMATPCVTAVAALHEGTLALLESACLSLLLVGSAPRHAGDLARAAPRGFVGCTGAFRDAAERMTNSLSDAFCGGEVWRVRGLGSVVLSRVRIVDQTPISGH